MGGVTQSCRTGRSILAGSRTGLVRNGVRGRYHPVSLESQCLSSWVVKSDQATGYATVELTYDEDATKSEEEFRLLD